MTCQQTGVQNPTLTLCVSKSYQDGQVVELEESGRDGGVLQTVVSAVENAQVRQIRNVGVQVA